MKYYKFKTENLISVKNLVTVEFLSLPAHYSFPVESHDFYEMVYVDRNSADYLINTAPPQHT